MTFPGPETLDFNTTGELFRYIHLINPNLMSIFLAITFCGFLIYNLQRDIPMPEALFTSSFVTVIIGSILYAFGVLTGWAAVSSILLLGLSFMLLAMGQK